MVASAVERCLVLPRSMHTSYVGSVHRLARLLDLHACASFDV